MKNKVGILCAGDDEVAPFLALLEDCAISEKAMLKFYEGRIGNLEVATLFCGACKVNAAIAAQILIDTYDCGLIINAGTAGGMDDGLRIFDTVISTDCAYWDVAWDILTEFHPWMDSVYFKADERLLSLAKSLDCPHKIVFGRMVTGESFIVDKNRSKINEKHRPLSVDMETAAIAHVCYANKTPYLAIRTITDTADHSGLGAFEENCAKASAIAAEITVALIRAL